MTVNVELNTLRDSSLSLINSQKAAESGGYFFLLPYILLASNTCKCNKVTNFFSKKKPAAYYEMNEIIICPLSTYTIKRILIHVFFVKKGKKERNKKRKKKKTQTKN